MREIESKREGGRRRRLRSELLAHRFRRELENTKYGRKFRRAGMCI